MLTIDDLDLAEPPSAAVGLDPVLSGSIAKYLLPDQRPDVIEISAACAHEAMALLEQAAALMGAEWIKRSIAVQLGMALSLFSVMDDAVEIA